jgi:hypothetical protein
MEELASIAEFMEEVEELDFEFQFSASSFNGTS